MFDHATGIVIGETTIIEDNVSILQQVTLGGTGNEQGDRHPKIRSGVLISAGAKVLGNIEIGEGAKIGAGSVVLSSVPPHTTVVGVPARNVGTPTSDAPAETMQLRGSAAALPWAHGPVVLPPGPLGAPGSPHTLMPSGSGPGPLGVPGYPHTT